MDNGFLSGLMDPRLHHHHFAAAHAAAAAAAAAAAHHPQQPQPVPPHTPHPPQPLAPAAAHHVPPQQPAPPPPTGSGFPWSGPSSQTATGLQHGFLPPTTEAMRPPPSASAGPHPHPSPHFFPPPPGSNQAAESLSMMSSMHAAQAQRAMAMHHAAAAAEAQRMAEVQRALEQSRKQQAAAAAAAAAAATSKPYIPDAASGTRETLFSHGLSPLDRGGLFPSHGSSGIMDPLSSSIPTPSPHHHLRLAPALEQKPVPVEQRPKAQQPPQLPPPRAPSPLNLYRPFKLEPPSSSSSGPAGPSAAAPASASSAVSHIAFSTATITSSSLHSRSVMSNVAAAAGTCGPIGVPAFRPQSVPLPSATAADPDSDPDETLSDDFGGQCCRTIPTNHITVQRWQRGAEERRQKRHQAKAAAAAAAAAPVKGEPEKSGRKQSGSGGARSGAGSFSGGAGGDAPPPPSTSGSKPVGIVIGRQGQMDHLSALAHGVPSISGSVPRTPLPSPGLLLPSAAASKKSHLAPSGVRAESTPPSHSHSLMPHERHPPHWPTPHHEPSPWDFPPGAGPGPPPPRWNNPIPMGYQLAKDPLTGQILLIPTSGPGGGGGGGAGDVPRGQWPTGPAPGHYDHGPFGPLGLSHHARHPHPHAPPPGHLAQYHHHLMLQQHQHFYHQHHQHQAAAAAAAAAASRDLVHHPLSPKPPFAVAATARPTAASGPKQEPETITVSSSDEEEAAASVRRKRDDTDYRQKDDAIPERKVEPAGEVKNAENAAPLSEPAEKTAVAETTASKPTSASQGVPIKVEPLNSSTEESAVAEREAEKVTSPEIGDGPAPAPSSSPLPPSPCEQRVPDQNATTATTLPTIKTEVRDSIESEATVAAPATITKVEPETVCAAGEAAPHVSEEVEREEEGEEEESIEAKTAAVPDFDTNLAAVPDFENNVKLLCAETLLAFATRSVEVIEEVEDKDAGLELLAEGVAIRAGEEGPPCGGCDVLRRATRADARCYGVHVKSINWSRMDITLLQTVTAYEYQQQVNWVDPMSRLRVRYDHHQYSSAESETRCRNYIADKMRQKEVSFDAEGNQVIVEDEYMGIKSLAAVIKKIKNTEIMSQLEVDLRAQLVQLQSLYRDKQKEMTRLKASPRKRSGSRSSSTSRQQRGPGRPKKRKLKSSSSKTKMGRPRKGSTSSKQQLPVIEEEKEEGEDNEGGCETEKGERGARAAEESDEEYDEAEEEMDDEGELEEEFDHDEENAAEEELDDLPPPLLEPCEPCEPPMMAPMEQEEEEEEEQSRPQQPPNPFANLTSAFGAPSSRSSSGLLLKPPKLTASLSPPGAGGSGGGSGGGKSASEETNLSTIMARFKKERSNPFANLMKIAARPDSSKASSKHEDDDEADGDNEETDDENEEEERERDGGIGDGLAAKPSSASEDECEEAELLSKADPDADKTASKRAPSDLSSAEDSAGCSSSKKRKSDKPRKHMGATETIVPKQSKNLFMMNCVNLQRGFKSTSAEAARALSNSSKDKEDEYDFTEEDEASPVNASPGLTRIKQAKIFSDYRSSPTFGTAAAAAAAETESATKGEGKTKKKRRSEEGTWKTSPSTATSPKTSTPRRRSTGGEKEEKKQQQQPQEQQQQSDDAETLLAKPQKSPPPYQPPQQPIKCDPPRSAMIQDSDLQDGQRIFMLQEGKFWPAKLNTTQLPDVYSIILEKQRGNRPIILPRDDILNEAILEIVPEPSEKLPIGTRVCVYWSKSYNCLFPGTVEQDDYVPLREDMIQVVLDDGDRRQVDMRSVRLLPENYRQIVYDPDPIATLRRRRMSNDSVDSGGSLDHFSRAERLHPSIQLHQTYTPKKESCLVSPNSTTSSLPSPAAKKSSSSSEKSSEKSSGKVAKKHKKKHRKHHHCNKHKHKSRKEQHGSQSSSTNTSGSSEDGQGLRIKLDGSFNNTTTYSIRSPNTPAAFQQHGATDSQDDDDDTSDEDENESRTEDEDTSSEEDDKSSASPRRIKPKPGMNPVTGRPLWQWVDGDEGYRRPGSKGKAKKLFHRAIQRGADDPPEVINVGDCAVFLSAARVDRPYIGRVELLWETHNGNMMTKVKWFYHPQEIELPDVKKFDLKISGGLFSSPHTDENDVQTIVHKCNVLPLKEYLRLGHGQSGGKKRKSSGGAAAAAGGSPEDSYYLAGSYDPSLMSINFQTGVSKLQQ